ncbi:MAG: response regulator transcription factor [Acidobacteriota bacterium]
MNKNGKINIMIIGDYLIFRHGLKRLLETEEQLQVKSDMEDLSAASLEIKNNKPDVIIINSTEVENSDFKDFNDNHCSDIPIIILTHSEDLLVHQKYLLLGASGVVTKRQSPEMLFKAIKHVNMEDLWFSRKVVLLTISKLIEEKKSAPEKAQAQKYSNLTQREWDVLNGICTGMKNKAIAENLFITETTVRHHLTSIFEKLNVKSRLALAILAFNDGIVEVPSENNNSFN